MNGAILVEGKEYISAIRASQKSDYTSDYIGQLCRAKRIPGKLIGKTWYVEFPMLLEYKNRRKPRGGIGKTANHIHTAEIRKISLPHRVSYEAETMALLPRLSKKISHIKSPLRLVFILESTVFSLVLIAAISLGFIYLKNTAPVLATQIEEKTQFLSYFKADLADQNSPDDSGGITNVSLLGSVVQAGNLFTDSWISLKQFSLNRFVKDSF